MARARGTAVLQLVKALRMAPDQARAHLPPELHRYLTDEIGRTDWYPEADYLALFTALVEMQQPSAVDLWSQYGTIAARHDLSTVYRGMLVRGRTLVETARVLRDLFYVYHDTGRFVVSGTDARAQLDIFDYASVSAGHCRFVTSFAREYLRMSLGRDVEVKETLCRALGADRCRREITPA